MWVPSPIAVWGLAAALGKMGDAENAAKALAIWRERTGIINPSLSSLLGRPEHHRTFQGGLAVAEERRPPGEDPGPAHAPVSPS